MPVHFVYRCHYDAPSEKHVRTFPDETVLDWFRRIWRPIADWEEAYSESLALFGGLLVHGFSTILTRRTEGPVPLPKHMGEVAALLEGYPEGDIRHGPHHVQVLTDDDELEMALYIFDDHYRKKHPGKTDFLLLPGWELPGGEKRGRLPRLPAVEDGELSGDGDGVTYFAGLGFYDSGNLSDLEDWNHVRRIPGLRLPDLARALLSGEDYQDQLGALAAALGKVLRARAGDDAGFRAAIRKNPADEATWGAYTDWLQERGRPPAGVELLERALRAAAPDRDVRGRRGSKDLVRATPHMAQACKHVARWDRHDLWHQWVLFDDRWAAAHPALAAGLLTFGTRWDVL